MSKIKMHWSDYIPLTGILIGAANWGLYGLSRLIDPNKGFDLVTWLGNALNFPILSNIIFTLVGILGFWGLISLIVAHFRK